MQGTGVVIEGLRKAEKQRGRLTDPNILEPGLRALKQLHRITIIHRVGPDIRSSDLPDVSRLYPTLSDQRNPAACPWPTTSSDSPSLVHFTVREPGV